MSEPIDWYENRHDLLCEQVFRCHDGALVRLNRTVPGDGTKWYVDDWDGSSWAMFDSTIEPGDLFGLVPDPAQAAGA